MSVNAGIPTQAQPAPLQDVTARQTGASEVGKFVRNGALFLLGAVVLYLAVYAVAEQINSNTTVRNRFMIVNRAPQTKYDYAILGASHAVVFDFEDMNARLQEMTGAKIINLANVGAGVVPNRLMLDYFLTAHQTNSIVYVVDSFGFYSREWNDQRLQDTALYARAPFDPALALLLFNSPDTLSVAPDYLLGFSKINNADRFNSDIGDDEATRFAKTYRPVKQIDNQRLAYLYPAQPDPQIVNWYLGQFEALIQMAQQRGIQVIVIKAPVPERWYKMLPKEAEFDRALAAVLARNNVEFHDFSLVSNEEKFFYNTDHLNRTGVVNFFENHLKGVLATGGGKVGELSQ